MSPLTSVRIVIRAAVQFFDDRAAVMGAALAYYALFSTAPLLILAVMLAGSLYGEEAARDRVVGHLRDALGPDAARELASVMRHVLQPRQGPLATAIGLGTLLFGALGAFLHVRHCLCVIWRLRPPARHGLLVTLFNYLLATAMVLAVGLLLVVSLAVSTALPAILRRAGLSGEPQAAWLQFLAAAITTAFIALFFTLVYRILSAGRISWRLAVYGAVVSSLLFAAGKTVIGRYLANNATTTAYGAAGSVVVFLIYVYYAAQIFFFGAELIQARRTRAEWIHVRPGDFTPAPQPVKLFERPPPD